MVSKEEREAIAAEFVEKEHEARAQVSTKLDLLHCPFCGANAGALWDGESEGAIEEPDEWPAESWCVVCDAHRGGCGASSGYKKSISEAVALWVRRASVDYIERFGAEPISLPGVHRPKEAWKSDFFELLIKNADKLLAITGGKVLVPAGALREVIRISDRQHPAWDAMKAALAGAGVKL